jgi:hypothetical protein
MTRSRESAQELEPAYLTLLEQRGGINDRPRGHRSKPLLVDQFVVPRASEDSDRGHRVERRSGEIPIDGFMRFYISSQLIVG